MSRPDQIFDALLVIECQAGKKSAIDLLVKRWHRKFCKRAYWYTRDKEQAKDIAQECWGVILKKIHFLRDPNSFGSWAIKIVTNKSLDWLRKQKKEPKITTEYDLPDTPADDPDNLASQNTVLIINSSIKKLPKKQQLVLQLFYLEGFSIMQIGEILEVSSGTVKSRLFTARESLKTILKNRTYEI